MRKIQTQYKASQSRYLERLARASAETGVNARNEANMLANRFGLSQKKRNASEYAGIASYLLSHYSSEMAYFIAVEINELFEPQLGYPPIGQIMVAMEKQESEDAACWIGCAIYNFPRAETAQLAFDVIKSPIMRSLVQAYLAKEDKELAEYITSSEILSSPPTAEIVSRTKVKHQPNLSDGIERMPRRLTDAERKGDRLFLHLQVVSSVLLLFSPVLGGVLGGWTGAAIGLLIGWVTRAWMQHSMGLRGSKPNDGFFIRMKERANGARLGVLEALIEKVRQRSFTKEQCVAITRAWDETREQLERTTSVEQKRELMNTFDEQIKRISYGQDG